MLHRKYVRTNGADVAGWQTYSDGVYCVSPTTLDRKSDGYIQRALDTYRREAGIPEGEDVLKRLATNQTDAALLLMARLGRV